MSTPGDSFASPDSTDMKPLDHELAWIVVFEFDEPQPFIIHGPPGGERPACSFQHAVMTVRDSTGQGLLAFTAA